MGINRGEEVHGEVHSADASGGVAIAFKSQGGVARSIGTNEVVMITDFNIVSVAGGDVILRAVLASATMDLFRGTVVANGGAAKCMSSPFAVPRGWALKVIAPAGVVDVQVEGFVIH